MLHTRLWDPERAVTLPMRGKFEGPCIPDPAVAPIRLTAQQRAALQSLLPEMPEPRLERFVRQYGLGREEAVQVTAEKNGADYFEAVVQSGADPQLAAHWVFNPLAPALGQRDRSFADPAVTPERLSALLGMLARAQISAGSAREVLAALLDSDRSPEELVSRAGFRQPPEEVELEPIVERVLAAQPAAAADFRAGRDKALGFLIGQAMQAAGGKADPKRVRELLISRLS